MDTASFKIEISKVQDFGNFELFPMDPEVMDFANHETIAVTKKPLIFPCNSLSA